MTAQDTTLQHSGATEHISALDLGILRNLVANSLPRLQHCLSKIDYLEIEHAGRRAAGNIRLARDVAMVLDGGGLEFLSDLCPKAIGTGGILPAKLLDHQTREESESAIRNHLNLALSKWERLLRQDIGQSTIQLQALLRNMHNLFDSYETEKGQGLASVIAVPEKVRELVSLALEEDVLCLAKLQTAAKRSHRELSRFFSLLNQELQAISPTMLTLKQDPVVTLETKPLPCQADIERKVIALLQVDTEIEEGKLRGTNIEDYETEAEDLYHELVQRDDEEFRNAVDSLSRTLGGSESLQRLEQQIIDGQNKWEILKEILGDQADQAIYLVYWARSNTWENFELLLRYLGRLGSEEAGQALLRNPAILEYDMDELDRYFKSH